MSSPIRAAVCCVLCTVLVTTDACAEDRLAAVRQELQGVLLDARTSPEAMLLRTEAQVARAAYEKEKADTAGVAELDIRIEALRKELHILAQERNGKLHTNMAAIEEKRKAWMVAESTLARALRGGERGAVLLAEKNRLLRETQPALAGPQRYSTVPATEEQATKE